MAQVSNDYLKLSDAEYLRAIAEHYNIHTIHPYAQHYARLHEIAQKVEQFDRDRTAAKVSS